MGSCTWAWKQTRYYYGINPHDIYDCRLAGFYIYLESHCEFPATQAECDVMSIPYPDGYTIHDCIQPDGTHVLPTSLLTSTWTLVGKQWSDCRKCCGVFSQDHPCAFGGDCSYNTQYVSGACTESGFFDCFALLLLAKCNPVGCCMPDGTCQNYELVSCCLSDHGTVLVPTDPYNNPCTSKNDIRCGGEGCCGCTWCCDMPRAACLALGARPLGAGVSCTVPTNESACLANPERPPCRSAAFDVEKSKGQSPGTGTPARPGRWRLLSRTGQRLLDLPPPDSGSTKECRLFEGVSSRDSVPVGANFGKSRFMGLVCGQYDRTRTSSKRYYKAPVVREGARFRFEVNYRKPCAEKPDPCLN